MNTEPMDVICDYCRQPAELVDSATIYGRSYGMIWLCRPCDAYVGVHTNSRQRKPLGRLANAELRRLRRAAHAAFDSLWRLKMRRHGVSKSRARSSGYKWLAEQLGIHRAQCHIGDFDASLCQRAINVCQPYLEKFKGTNA